MEIIKLRNMLEDEANKKKRLEEEIIILRSQLLQLNFEADQVFVLCLLRFAHSAYSLVINFS